MMRPPIVSRGLILTMPTSQIRATVGRYPGVGETWHYRIPAYFEVSAGLTYQPPMQTPIRLAQIIAARGDGTSTIRVQLRADV